MRKIKSRQLIEKYASTFKKLNKKLTSIFKEILQDIITNHIKD